MHPTTKLRGPGRSTLRLAGAVVCSRLLVALAGVFGATQWSRFPGWHKFDPGSVTKNLGSVGNALAGAAVRWDSIHYLTIARVGYHTRGNTVFFPLYPLLIRVFKPVFDSPVIAGVLISTVSFVVALVLLYRLASRELNARAADATVLLLAFTPLSFFFTAVYTESLFLALSLGAFELASRKRWFWALLVAALATLTRVPGILLLAPLAIMWWRSGERSPRSFLPFALPLLALAGFATYLHGCGYGWLAPIRNQESVHNHTFSGPFKPVYEGAKQAWWGIQHVLSGDRLLSATSGSPTVSGTINTVLFVALVIAVLALILTFRHLPLEYGVYSTLILLLCLSSPSAGIPLSSLDRYLLIVFPLWIAAADWLVRRRLLYPVLILSALGLCFYTIQFARWTFVA